MYTELPIELCINFFFENTIAVIDEQLDNKKLLLLRVEKLLQGIYTKVASFETQQQIADACKVLESARYDINAPYIKMDHLKPPTINDNRKGRKAKCGAKPSTQRLKIALELHEEQQKKDQKKKEKKEKEDEEFKKKRKLLELEERSVELEQKKRKLTVFVKSEPVLEHEKTEPVKTEKVASPYDR